MRDARPRAMANAFRIGKIFGIELRVDPSWLFIFALVGWSLTSLFSAWHPDWTLTTSIVVAIVSALTFFASVLFHELAHSLVALGYGVPVRDITLYLFGGVSNIEREPPTPGAELLIAIVGPIASIGLGMAMLIASSLIIGLHSADVDSAAEAAARLGPVGTMLTWLGPVNVMLGVFNLIPGFPLDGGRVLRAIVWKVTGSLQRATRVAAGVGRGVGWGFIALGVVMALGYRVPFFGRGLTGGLWLAMIGLFLRAAAGAHLRGALVDQALLGVRVGDVMRPAVFVDARLPIRDLVDGWFMRHDDSAYPVVDEQGAFSGLVSVDDVRRIAQDPRFDWDRLKVRDIMTPVDKLIISRPTEDLSVALRKLGAASVRQLPVLDALGVLVGMLFEKDIARWLEFHAEANRGQAAQVRHA